MKTPKFLMGGIRLSQNFLGTGTMKAGTYTVIEAGIKTAPFLLFFYALGQSGNL